MCTLSWFTYPEPALDPWMVDRFEVARITPAVSQDQWRMVGSLRSPYVWMLLSGAFGKGEYNLQKTAGKAVSFTLVPRHPTPPFWILILDSVLTQGRMSKRPAAEIFDKNATIAG
jgi:hypothetical protein